MNMKNTLKQDMDRIESLERYSKQHSKEINSLTALAGIMKENKLDLASY